MARGTGQSAPRKVKVTGDLGSYEGVPINATSIKLVGAGDGLSEPLTIDGRKFALGDVVTFVVEGEITAIGHRWTDRETTDALTQIHTVKLTDLMHVEDPLPLRKELASQRDRVLREKERAIGVQRLEDSEDSDDGSVAPKAPKGTSSRSRGPKAKATLAAVPDAPSPGPEGMLE